ncbi:hypothetical protein [Streptomyces brasiliensis]|uniref:Integral membrane protein n=1 Tax=Streptomyces brasiliensis TaxID=1954 RepID=A0A917KM03_9ACTN|nr:hypothetical protein [Streptomyces brasiliensis]GGJ20327.1 hypothetical protein GCM10010121_034040 [Streptomyces brasiliensis]
MPDRSLRLLTFPPQSAQGGERGALLLRERPASPPDAPSGGQSGDGRGGAQQDDNPFAPPPEGATDSPWRPRHRPDNGEDSPSGPPDPSSHSPWGSQWSDRQPGRSPGGFGERPGGGPEGPGGGNGPGPGMRWDPTDPAQRRARYALLGGMWAFFFALFGWSYVALLLGALALYWGVSALRTKPRTPDPDAPAAPQQTGRPQTTAAISGLVTATLALALVAGLFTARLAYRDYYTCVNDALTSQAKQSCEHLLPPNLRVFLGTNS